jgi:hypothetical protein
MKVNSQMGLTYEPSQVIIVYAWLGCSVGERILLLKEAKMNKSLSSINIAAVALIALFLPFTWSHGEPTETSYECKTCVTYGDNTTECTPFPCPPDKAKKYNLEAFWSVTSTLANIEQTDDLEDTLHKNPFMLEAAGLFLDLADSHNLPEEDLEFIFNRLFPVPLWKNSLPWIEIKRIRSGLHIMSIGNACTMPGTSLYLFEGRVHHKLDSGEAGCIDIQDVKITDSIVTVRYNRAPCSTGPEIVTATLTKQGTTWKITRTKAEE